MEERESDGRLPVMLGVAASLGAVLLIAGLLAYSLIHALDGGESAAPRRAAARPPTLTPSITAAQLALTPYSTEPIPRAFYLFVLCDGETVEGSIYPGLIYGDYVTLLATPDHDIIVDLVGGKPTIFPQRAQVFKSECAKKMFATSSLQ